MWGLFGPENQSQLKTKWWTRDWCQQCFFWRNHGNVPTGSFHSPTALWSGCGRRADSALLHGGQTWNLCYQTRMQERKSQLEKKKIKVHLFFGWFYFNLVALFLCGWWVEWCHKQPRGTGWVPEHCLRSLLRPCRGRGGLCLSGTLQEVTTGSEHGRQQNCERTAPRCWQSPSILVTVEGWDGLEPTTVKSIEAVLYGFSPALAPALLCPLFYFMCLCISALSLAF